MLETEIIAGFCLGILATWFLLRIEVAEALLILMVLSATSAGLWLWREGWSTQIVEGAGMFALLVMILGSLRLGIEKLSDTLTAHRKTCASALGFGRPYRDDSRPRA